MAFRLQRRELLASQFRASARHHHCRIPSQDAGSAAECMEPTKFLFELLIWSQGHGQTASEGKGRILPTRFRLQARVSLSPFANRVLTMARSKLGAARILIN
jgi:hypothetical protein